MQIVFQDPYSSLNPMISVGRSLKLALRVAGRPASDLNGLLHLVELPLEFAVELNRLIELEMEGSVG